MKRAIVLVIFIAAGFAGGVLWMKKREAAAARQPPSTRPTPRRPPTKKQPRPQVSRDTNGNAVIAMSDKTQEDLGHPGEKPGGLPDEPGAKGLRTGAGPRAAGGAGHRAGLGPGRLHRFQQRTRPAQDLGGPGQCLGARLASGRGRGPARPAGGPVGQGAFGPVVGQGRGGPEGPAGALSSPDLPGSRAGAH